MERLAQRRKIVLEPCFVGIFSPFIKKVAMIVFLIVLMIIANRFKKNIYGRNDFDSFMSLVKGLKDFMNEDMIFKDIGLLMINYSIVIMLIFNILRKILELIKLLYELGARTVFDYENEKLIVRRIEFPFSKMIIESKFNEIIQVEVHQDAVDRMVDAGNMYIDYFVLSRLDSKIKTIEIPHISEPYNRKLV